MKDHTSHLYDVIRQIRPAFRHIAKSVENRGQLADLNIGMRAVLERIYELGPQTAPDIARALLVERQYAQRSINELLHQKLVIKSSNPNHKRSWLIELTEDGRKRFETIKKGAKNDQLTDVINRIETKIDMQMPV